MTRKAGGRDISSAYRDSHTCWQHPLGSNDGVVHTAPARATFQRTAIRRRRAAGVLCVVVAIAAFFSFKSLVPSALTASASQDGSPPFVASSPATVTASSSRMPSAPSPSSPASPIDHSGNGWREALGEAGGVIPDGTTIYDAGVPGVAKLAPGLHTALRRAAADAGRDGVEFVVDSGWRSATYQAHLLQEAVLKYGSEAEATRWVATPKRSAHVSGDAADIGPSAAAAWLSEHGAAYGLCQIYDNEPWHYELRPDAAAHGCPPTFADPTHDPRMQR